MRKILKKKTELYINIENDHFLEIINEHLSSKRVEYEFCGIFMPFEDDKLDIKSKFPIAVFKLANGKYSFFNWDIAGIFMNNDNIPNVEILVWRREGYCMVGKNSKGELSFLLSSMIFNDFKNYIVEYGLSKSNIK